jgi:hypothetical protein
MTIAGGAGHSRRRPRRCALLMLSRKKQRVAGAERSVPRSEGLRFRGTLSLSPGHPRFFFDAEQIEK